MEIPVLYGLAQQQNIPIFAFPLPNTGSMSLMDEQGRCFIGMDEVHSQLQAAYHRTAIFFQGVDIMVQDGFTL